MSSIAIENQPEMQYEYKEEPCYIIQIEDLKKEMSDLYQKCLEGKRGFVDTTMLQWFREDPDGRKLPTSYKLKWEKINNSHIYFYRVILDEMEELMEFAINNNLFTKNITTEYGSGKRIETLIKQEKEKIRKYTEIVFKKEAASLWIFEELHRVRDYATEGMTQQKHDHMVTTCKGLVILSQGLRRNKWEKKIEKSQLKIINMLTRLMKEEHWKQIYLKRRLKT